MTKTLSPEREWSAPVGTAEATSRRWHDRSRITLAADLAGGAAFAFLVGRDGSPGWQLVRVVVVAASTLWLIRTVSRRTGRGWIGLAMGLITLIAGAGIAFPHVVKTGFTMTSLAGVVTLVAGISLLVSSSGTILASLHDWRRPVAVVAEVFAVLVLAWTLVPAVMATNVPPTSLSGRTPADVGLVYDDVELLTSDGVRLSAWYVPSTNGAAVVIRHGAGSTRSDVVDQAAVLAGGGYGTLLVDARGHGTSGGRAMDFGWYGDADISAGVDFLTTRPDVEPARIGVVGLSMGGEEALGALGADDRIQAVVAEGATARTSADKAWLSEEFGPRGWIQEQLERIQYAVVDILTSAETPRSLASSIVSARPRPVLLITAGQVADEGHAAEHIRAASPSNVQVWNVPGSGHTAGLATDPAAWRQHVLAFLDVHLAGVDGEPSTATAG